MINRPKLTAVMAALVLLSVSCSGLGGIIEEPTETPTPVIIGGSSSGDSDQADQSDQPDQPDQPAEPDVSDPVPGPDNSAAAQCLVGRWRANHDSFAGYLEDAVETPAEGLVDFEFETGRGDLFMEFSANGEMSMSGEDFQIDVTIVGLASFTFILEADGRATYASDDQAIAIWDVDYASSTEGGGEVLTLPEIGAEAVLNITPDGLFGYARSEGYTYQFDEAPDDAGVSPYQCSGDILIIGPEGYQPVRWERVVN